MRSWLICLSALLCVNLFGIACPKATEIRSLTFNVPSSISWYQFAFIEIPGSDYSSDSLTDESNVTWSSVALYAPVDVGNNDLDEEYKNNITNLVNIAKDEVEPKSSESVSGECFYQALKYMHIMFLLKANTG